MPFLRAKPMTGGEWATLAALVLIVLLLASTLIPSRRRGEPGWRFKCASNLRMIGLAAKMYADGNGGAFPPTMGTIVATQDITTDVFLCPTSSDTRVRIADASTRFATTQAASEAFGRMIDDAAGHHCSYIWAGAGLNSGAVAPEDILAFDMPTNHHDDGITVLFGDGHVEWMSRQTGPGFPEFDKFYADFQAGKRPLRWVDPPPTTRP